MNINLEISETELDLLRDHWKRIGLGDVDLTDREVVLMVLNSLISKEYAMQASESEGYKV